MTYDTMNPVPSTDPRDLYDNAGITDKYVNGQEPFVPDRLGVQRRTWKGMEVDFNNAQEGRQEAFDQFLEASAFINIGDYGPGITFTSRSQYIVRDGYAYRLALSTTLPYTTTGNWALEQNKFSLVNSDDILRRDLLDDAKGAALVAWKRAGAETVETTLGGLLGRKTFVDVFDFMNTSQIADVKGGSTANHTAALTAALNYAIANLPATVVFGKGKFNYTSLPNCAKTGLNLRGEGSRQTVLKCTSSGVALLMDAFSSGSDTDPFVFACNLEGLTVEGNAGVTSIIRAQGVSHSHWSDVNVREAEPTAGIGFDFKGVMLSRFDELRCSIDINPMTSKPRFGIKLDEGRRATISVGQSSEDQFNSCYFDGIPVGGRLVRADQITFNGGAFQSCSVYGIEVWAASRYNSFLGTGFESKYSLADISDEGQMSRYVNTYASKRVILAGKQQLIDGGYFERIEITSDASHAWIRSVVVNHWGLGAGGLFDSGFATRYGAIAQETHSGFPVVTTQSYIYPKKPRTELSVTASPFTWVNATGQYVELVTQSGVYTQIRQSDGDGDFWLKGTSTTTPIPTCTTLLLRPGDSAEFSFSSAVGSTSILLIRHNGI